MILLAFSKRVLRRIIGTIDCGRLLIHTPDGARIEIEGDQPGPQAQLTIHSWKCLTRLLTGWDLGFAEAYMTGEWSTPDLPALLGLACSNSRDAASAPALRPLLLLLRLRHAGNRNTRSGSRRNIAAHYDLGNNFYAGWLDRGMNYSSALYSSPSQTLEDAQRTKLDRVVDLLEIKGDERVLEIGCGWGSLAERLIQRHGCRVTGLTLSVEQLAYARRRLIEEGLCDKGDLRLLDYRDAPGEYDRVVSIEMLEAVGESYWPTFFSKLQSRLRRGGVGVLQAITIDESRFHSYRSQPDFIQKYIFPGGMLPTTEIIDRQIAQAGLQLVHTEYFGDSYARTLIEWRHRFGDNWPNIQNLGFDVRFKRMWDYYLAYCQAGFETGFLNVGLYKISKA